MKKVAKEKPARKNPIAGHPVLPYLLTVGFAGMALAWLVQSPILSQFIPGPSIRPMYFGGYPTIIWWLTLAGFYLSLRIKNPSSFAPSKDDRKLAIATVVATVVFAIMATNPPAPIWKWLVEIGNGSIVGGDAVGTVLFLIVALPAIALLPVFFSVSFLHRHQIVLVLGLLIFAAYLLFAVVQSALHAELAPTLLGLSFSMLSALIPDAGMDPGTYMLSSGPFSAYIGPSCSGSDSIILFIFCFLAVWYMRSHSYAFHVLRTLAALASGIVLLYALNVVRIVLIMMIGRHYPGMGVELFHGTIGALIFLIVFIGYYKIVFPFLRK